MTSSWLVPHIAHRGLHDAKRGIIENTASAFQAAIHCGYGIETDIIAAAGGEPVVFHDETLERLTHGRGSVADFTAAELRAIEMRSTRDRILALPEFLELVGGRAALFLEIKSGWSTDRTLEARIAKSLAGYKGPVSVMSFDPVSMAAMREYAPRIRRGLSAMRYTRKDCPRTAPFARFRLTHMLESGTAKPDFLTYEINSLALLAPAIRRRHPSLPLIAWTIRTAEERRKANIFSDAMIFEGFRPSRSLPLSQRERVARSAG